MTLQAGSRPAHSLDLTRGPGAAFRGVFHRLVTDKPDDDALGNQTVRCALRELVVVRYSGASCVDQAQIRVGRPPSENNNNADQSLHDVRQVWVKVTAFCRLEHVDLVGAHDATTTTIRVSRNWNARPHGILVLGEEVIAYTGLDQTADPHAFTGCTRGVQGSTAVAHPDFTKGYANAVDCSVTLGSINADLDTVDERFAQAGVRLRRPVSINIGDGNGVLNNAALLLAAPFIISDTPAVHDPTPYEQAIVTFKDSSLNTIDIFYGHTFSDVTGDPSLYAAISYPASLNQTGDNRYKNMILMNAGGAHGDLTLAHEMMHILRNSGHRSADPETALLYPTSPVGKDVGGPKRMGPYPDAKTAGVGQDDTEVVRSNAEVLP